MNKLTEEIEAILNRRFGKDSIIALATTVDGMPFVRNVNSFYFDGAFYVLTCGSSNKMKQIEANPSVAIAGDWFTSQGKAVNLGWIGKDENKEIAAKMRVVFAEWIHNGHNDLSDVNTCVLQIKLTYASLLSHGTRYEIDFSE